jgi:hypothetical protein
MSEVQIITDLLDVPENGERDLCLVVEVPKVGYEDSYNHCSSKELGLNASHWEYISNIHAVMPNAQRPAALFV